MNKNTISSAIAGIAFLALAAVAQAAPQFSHDLSRGMRNSAEVRSLQSFLKDKGYFSGEATGNYLNQTAAAVSAFQKANGISPTGTFGPLSRAAANGSAVSGPRAHMAFSKHPHGSVEVGQTQTVAWTSDANAPSTVRVNIIRKVSDNPARYELVRTVASKSNNGTATWVPAKSDIGANVSVEIGCGPTANACDAAENTSGALAVIDSNRYANTASAFEAIEQSSNK